jgi:hypothetical protein
MQVITARMVDATLQHRPQIRAMFISSSLHQENLTSTHKVQLCPTYTKACRCPKTTPRRPYYSAHGFLRRPRRAPELLQTNAVRLLLQDLIATASLSGPGPSDVLQLTIYGQSRAWLFPSRSRRFVLLLSTRHPHNLMQRSSIAPKRQLSPVQQLI